MNEDMLRRGVAEFIGTFTLIFIGGGAGIAVAIYSPTGGNLVAVALANGLAIGIMVTNLGHISGGDAARYHGFKCPHCKLFVPLHRAPSQSPKA